LSRTVITTKVWPYHKLTIFPHLMTVNQKESSIPLIMTITKDHHCQDQYQTNFMEIKSVQMKMKGVHPKNILESKKY